ncbi:MAG TPA: hypothetical protein PKY59_17410 [Pyrinomonadaceae bacterium]|nr:hypothetical protein [Pyrinomonadaceae bacterium]
MKLNRRNFLISSSTTLFGAVTLANLPKQVFGANSEFVLQNANAFRNLTGTIFTIYKNDSAIESVLTEVKKYAPKNKKALADSNSESKMNRYTLIFNVPQDNLQQDYYQIFHQSLGLFNLMLVPGFNQENQPVLVAAISQR